MSTFVAQQQETIKEQIKEAFFASGNRVLRPIVQVLNDHFPSAKRLRSSPAFNQEVFDEHDKIFKRARNLLYEQRNLVQRKWLPRYVILTNNSGDSIATTEFRNVIVKGALDRLYETLIAYMPMLVPDEKSRQLMPTVKNLYEYEAAELTRYLEKYTANFAPNVISIDADYE